MSNTPKNPADAGPDLQRRVSPQCWGPGQFVVVATFRYCLGRQTYIVQECADWLTLHWPVIEQPVRNLIQRELEAAFVKDDAIRAAAGPGTGYKPLGWDCDRREWERVRSQWANVRGEAPVEVASNEGLGLAPERAGQPRMMIIIDGAQEDETGHWYSPAAVREMLAAERDRCATRAWVHYMDVCKVLRLPPSEHEHWNAALSVRSQAIDDDPMPCGHADILDDAAGGRLE